MPMSQITTHVLDITAGRPAAGISIVLFRGENDDWTEMTRGITNNDGRITDLLPNNVLLTHGIYRLRFHTKDYFDREQVPTFYPYIDIIFDIESNQHYHIPLLLSPFGYNTYRGS